MTDHPEHDPRKLDRPEDDRPEEEGLLEELPSHDQSQEDTSATGQRREDRGGKDKTATESEVLDVEELEEKLPSQAAAVHAVIRRAGEKELKREFMALLLSAIAGGITMSSSFLGRGLLKSNLPETGFGFLIDSAGYTLGFIFVIATGQQLFTENTVTPVLPFMSRPTKRNFGRLMRLWGTVLLGNTIGGTLAAAVFAFAPVFSPELLDSFRQIGSHMLDKPWAEMLGGGMISGWLIATLVWAIFAEPRAKISLIFLTTYLMAIGDFPHVIVGTVEAAFMILLGEVQIVETINGFWLPTLLGNVLGGTFIFALISHAQVRADVDDPAARRRAKRKAKSRKAQSEK